MWFVTTLFANITTQNFEPCKSSHAPYGEGKLKRFAHSIKPLVQFFLLLSTCPLPPCPDTRPRAKKQKRAAQSSIFLGKQNPADRPQSLTLYVLMPNLDYCLAQPPTSTECGLCGSLVLVDPPLVGWGRLRVSSCPETHTTVPGSSTQCRGRFSLILCCTASAARPSPNTSVPFAFCGDCSIFDWCVLS